MIACGYKFDIDEPYQFIFDLLVHFRDPIGNVLPPDIVLTHLLELLFEEKLSLSELIRRVKSLLM
jgi:hypothetical protein